MANVYKILIFICFTVFLAYNFFNSNSDYSAEWEEDSMDAVSTENIGSDANGTDIDQLNESSSVNSQDLGAGNFKSRIDSMDIDLQIEYLTGQTFYIGCANELNIQVPALGQSFNPSYRAKGGNVIKNVDNGSVLLFPNSSEMTLEVYHEGQYIGSETFKAVDVPFVSIVPYIGTRAVDLKKGMSTAINRMEVKVIPDPEFQRVFPRDARFRVTKTSCYLMRDGLAVGVIEMGSSRINLTSLTSKAKKGDVLEIEIVEVKRANYRAQIEDFDRFNPDDKVIRIPLK